jgi:hypothetical protein
LKEAAMPTVVHFIGNEKPITLEDGFDQVNMQLGTESKAGQFVRTLGGGSRTRVTIYESGLAYIEEATEAGPEPMVAVG